MSETLAEAQDIQRAQALAERWCANCHVVNRARRLAERMACRPFPHSARKDVSAATLKGAMTATQRGARSRRSRRLRLQSAASVERYFM